MCGSAAEHFKKSSTWLVNISKKVYEGSRRFENLQLLSHSFFRKRRKIPVNVMSGQRGERNNLPTMSGMLGGVLLYPNPAPN